jgi:hypothetical protein
MNSPRVIVAGGRAFNDYALMRRELDAFFSEMGARPIIVSGGAKGADMLGERYAKEHGLFVIQVPVPYHLWDSLGRGAGYTRNNIMADIATHLAAFWDGQSRGTKHMIDIARARGLKARVVRYEGSKR